MKELLSSVSPKGQVTLPVEIRKALGIKPKDKVAFRLEQGKVELTPAASPLEESYQAIPALKPSRSWQETEELVAEELAQNVAREGLDWRAEREAFEEGVAEEVLSEDR